VIILLVLTKQVMAVPYATGVKQVGSTVNFTLNEPADTVTITRDGGSQIVINAAVAGSHSFDMTGYSGYTISVTHSAPVGWAESSISAGNPMLGFERANGVAVNKNPGSPNFGRFYVSQRDSTVSALGRQMGDGIYVFNADATDAFGITDPNDMSAARTAGLDFSGSDSSPFRLSVGPDDTLYISDASDIHGGIYHTDADVSTGGNLLAGLGGVQPIVGQNHGSIISTPVVIGSLAGGDLVLYTIDQDLPGSVPDTGSHVWRYDIGASANYTGTGTIVVDASTLGTNSDGSDILDDSNSSFDDGIYNNRIDADITRDPRTGNYLITQVGSGMLIMDPTFSTILFNSKQFKIDNAITSDLFSRTISAQVSPDGKTLAIRKKDLLGPSESRTILVPLDADGLPRFDESENYYEFEIVNSATFYSFFPRAPIAYDLAGNFYTAGNRALGGERLGIYGPGGDSAAITRSDGTFTINGLTHGDFLAGDLNGDGFVGIDDLNIVLIAWNQSVTHGVLLQGDSSGDGFVGIEDLNLVLGNWNAGTPPPLTEAGTTIPEPGSLTCLALVALILLPRPDGTAPRRDQHGLHHFTHPAAIDC
jgi:hypothetical protein